jgi:acyl-CoA thioesterase
MTVLRGGSDVGDDKELTYAMQELDLLGKRIVHLRDNAVKARTDKEYEENRARLQKFQAKYADDSKALETLTDQCLLRAVKDWTMYMSEEDEKENRPVPITVAGLAELDFDLKYDILTKMNKALGVGDEKKSSDN